MAAKTVLLLLAPVTLCFLLVLGAQGTEATSVAVIFHGVVQCSNNPSTVVSNATVQVVINGTTVVATGQTTSKGQFLITVNVTSDQQLISLVNNSSIKVVSTASPNVCGASANAVVKLDDAPIALAGYRFLGEINKDMLLDFIHAISPNDGRGQQNIAADSTRAQDDGASIAIDIVNEGLFVYAFSVAVVNRV